MHTHTHKPTPAGALNRAEWVKFVGLFFNREREASDVFEGIKAEYEATRVGIGLGEGGGGGGRAEGSRVLFYGVGSLRGTVWQRCACTCWPVIELSAGIAALIVSRIF
jgi:hypothetical protein